MDTAKKGCRPVRVLIATGNDSVRMMIEDIFKAYMSRKMYRFVKKVTKTDMVIFTDLETIKLGLSPSNAYVFVGLAYEARDLPRRVVDLLRAARMSQELSEQVDKTWLKLKPLKVETSSNS